MENHEDAALVRDLCALLDVSRQAEDSFRGARKKGGIGRVFGGQVIAQALVSAERTVEPDRSAHSLHAYFLRGGSEDHEIDFAVDRQFDGRSFSNRRVVASQQGQAILNCAVSFQKAQEGLHHQSFAMPDVPGPDDIPSGDDVRRRIAEKVKGPARQFLLQPRPIEMRMIDARHWETTEPSPPFQNGWFRAKSRLPDDPALHRAVLAYLSDMQLLGTSALPHGLSWARGEMKSASLDHAIWFHEEFRADEWLLYSSDSPWAGHGRGFNRGSIYTLDGRLVASVAQEGMIRKVTPKDR